MLNSLCSTIRLFLIYILLPILIILVILGFIEMVIEFLFWRGYE